MSTENVLGSENWARVTAIEPIGPEVMAAATPSSRNAAAWPWSWNSRTLPEMLAEASTISTSSRRSEEHTSELQSLMRISYAVFCLKKKKNNQRLNANNNTPSKNLARTTT